MNFFSHSKKLEDGTIQGSKLLKHHIDGVAQKALIQFKPTVQFCYKNEDLKELLGIIIRLHDLGKYTSYFQNYLLQIEPIDNLLKQHAKFGGYAFTFFNFCV